jgi:probable O-glycosylation ligase (exosortase A-associated)
MRDIIVLAIILGSIPICFFRPYFGVLMWTWIAYFNPHRFTWDYAYHFPVAWAVAIPTLVGMMFIRKTNRGLLMRETVLLLCLWAWFAITWMYATHQPIFGGHAVAATLQLQRVSKILLMTGVTILLVTSHKKLKYLCMVVALSIGALALKGAIFGIRTGGASRVWGPPDSFLGDNNDLALATNMALPIIFFLARDEERRWLRLLLRLLFVCGILCVVLTYSRGGLLGLAVVLTAITVKSKRKSVGLALLLVCGFLILTFAPPPWMMRMQTFLQGSLDTSAEGRLNAWRFAWVLASHYPITGGGFETFTPDLFARFTPQLRFAGPHSVYFQLLGEQGFVGLSLFLLLLGCCWLTLRRLRTQSRGVPDLGWMAAYSHMLEASLLGYLVSGAFLPRAYFDFYFQLIAMTIILKVLYRREVARAAAPEPAPLVAEVAEEAVAS